MFRKNAIEVAECVGGQYVFPSDKKGWKEAAAATAFSSVVILPMTVFADTGSGFDKILSAAYRIADYAAVLVIIFAGTSLMFGNRPRAMQTLIGACGGFLLIKYADDIVDFLNSLTETGAY